MTLAWWLRSVAWACGEPGDPARIEESIRNNEERLGWDLGASARTEVTRRLALAYGSHALHLEFAQGDAAAAQAMRDRAVALWGRLAHEERMVVEAWSCTAQLETASRRPAGAIAAWERLIAAAPRSEEARSGHLALADLLHEVGSLERALVSYLKAWSLGWDHGGSGHDGLSGIRAAQVFWQLGDEDRAVELGEVVIAEGRPRAEARGERLPMQMETALVADWVAQREGPWEAAIWVAYRVSDPAQQDAVIEAVIDAAVARGDSAAAVALTESLLARPGGDRNAVRWLVRLVQGCTVLAAAGDVDAANGAEATRDAARRLGDMVREPHVWARERAGTEELKNAVELARTTVATSAETWQARADRWRLGGGDASRLYRAVHDLLALWVDLGGIPSARAHLQIADAAYHGGRYAVAHAAYVLAVRSVSLEEQGRLRLAAHGAILAANAWCAGGDAAGCRAQLGAVDAYVDLFGSQDAESLRFLLESARLQTGRGDYEDAAGRWSALLTDHPDASVRAEAARNAADHYGRMGAWELQRRVARYAARGADVSKADRLAMQELWAWGQRRRIEEQYARNGDEALRGLLLYQWWLHWNALPDAPGVLDDAAVAFARAGDLHSAIACRERLAAVAGTDAQENALLLADLRWERSLEVPLAEGFVQAASAYAAFATRWPDAPNSGEAAVRAMAAWQLGDPTGRAAAAFGERWLRGAATDPSAPRVRWALSAALRARGNLEAATREALVAARELTGADAARAWADACRMPVGSGSPPTATCKRVLADAAIGETERTAVLASVYVARIEDLDRGVRSLAGGPIQVSAVRRAVGLLAEQTDLLGDLVALGVGDPVVHGWTVRGASLESMMAIVHAAPRETGLTRRQQAMAEASLRDWLLRFRGEAVDAYEAAIAAAVTSGRPVAREAREGLQRLGEAKWTLAEVHDLPLRAATRPEAAP